MEREKLEGHQATLRGLRDTIGTMQQSGSPPPLGDVVDLIDALAGIVGDFISEQIVAGEHAHAVAELIKRSGGRVEQADTLGGPWEPVVDGRPTKRFVRENGALRAQKVSEEPPAPRMVLDEKPVCSSVKPQLCTDPDCPRHGRRSSDHADMRALSMHADPDPRD